MHQKIEYERAFASFQQNNPSTWPKYASPTSEELFIGFLVQTQRIPSVTTVQIALDELVRRNLLLRVDGKTETDDQKEAVRLAQQNLDRTIQQVASAPLTAAEQSYFASLSQNDLAAKYWANDGYCEFRVRYDLAHRQAGFQLPSRPSVIEELDEDGAVVLTAAEWNSLPANVAKEKLRSPRYKLAVQKLIKQGLI